MEVFNDEEVAMIVHAAVSVRKDGITEDELRKIVEWACDARLNAVLLDQVLRGAVAPGLSADGELTFCTADPHAAAKFRARHCT
jgi:hypothetical protein